MARCVKSEKMGRPLFYGAMITEGVVALIWATVSMYFFYGGAAQDLGQPLTLQAPEVVTAVSQGWLGTFGGILAMLGVVAAPITSGDTALRSARLIVADYLKLDQKPISNRLMLALPLFLCVFGMVFVDFNIVWRYFAWTNQSLAVFTLWAGTIWLYRQKTTPALSQGQERFRFGYLIALIPALFMTMVCSSYILIAPEGLHLPEEYRWIGYLIAGCITLCALGGFIAWAYRRK
jgi:carbon starvation protein CstA